MERYFVKAPVSGWHEVDRKRFQKFIDNLRDAANPPKMTMDELIKSRTKITTAEGGG